MKHIQLARKLAFTLIGGAFVLLGAMFIIVPGPSLLFIVPGLILLSYDYPVAKQMLRKCMKLMTKSAAWIDEKLRERKYR
ncbi:PGPGW domain-containing protein [Glaciecola siphonariae]|uniref:PGPGW domain-containing protein n=1 Tax=Glaciecola siphonariae TaxID=521012 RepID=A0ABV9LRL4_9ALTE